MQCMQSQDFLLTVRLGSWLASTVHGGSGRLNPSFFKGSRKPGGNVNDSVSQSVAVCHFPLPGENEPARLPEKV